MSPSPSVRLCVPLRFVCRRRRRASVCLVPRCPRRVGHVQEMRARLNSLPSPPAQVIQVLGVGVGVVPPQRPLGGAAAATIAMRQTDGRTRTRTRMDGRGRVLPPQPHLGKAAAVAAAAASFLPVLFPSAARPGVLLARFSPSARSLVRLFVTALHSPPVLLVVVVLVS